MNTKHRQMIYILLAFLALTLIQFTGVIINLFIQNDLLAHVVSSSGLVINVTGLIIGLYNIYQGLSLRKHSSLWGVILLVGIICVWFNVYALSL